MAWNIPERHAFLSQTYVQSECYSSLLFPSVPSSENAESPKSYSIYHYLSMGEVF